MAAKKHKAKPKPKGGEKSPPFLLRGCFFLLRCHGVSAHQRGGVNLQTSDRAADHGSRFHPLDGAAVRAACARPMAARHTRENAGHGPGKRKGSGRAANVRGQKPARQTPRENRGPQCSPPPGGPPRNREPRRKAAWGRPAGKIRPARPLRRVRGGEGLNLTVFWPECPITFEIWFEKNRF